MVFHFPIRVAKVITRIARDTFQEFKSIYLVPDNEEGTRFMRSRCGLKHMI